jgi:RNA polymerase sigma-70 factor (ECF subfamily)
MSLLACRPDVSLASSIAARRSELLGAARQMVRSEEAEDLAQTTVERALKNLNKFQPDSNLSAWLRRIMSNLVVDSWRHDSCHRRCPLEECDLAAPVPEPEALWQDLSAAEIRQAVAQLPTIFREVFELHSQGASYVQVSRRLGIPTSTVGTRLLRSRAQLRVLLAPAIERRAAARLDGAKVSALPVKRPESPLDSRMARSKARGIGPGLAAVTCARR